MTQLQTDAAAVPTTTREVDAVVVGAGFAGMYMIHRLRQLNFSVQVFEAGTDLGGTWYWNRYPGARCDVESINYSYSFDKELEQEWTWSERYATQPEILRYADHVAERFDLRRSIQFGTRMTRAIFDEDTKRWDIETDQGDRISARFCIMAVGCLSVSKKPEVPGIDSFQGPWYHTGHWPHEGVDLSGKRVGIIGTGSSAIQSIPLIAKQAGHLTVFQRTPNFSMPAKNAPLDAEQYAQLKQIYPEWREQARQSGFGVPNDLPEFSALEVDQQDRDKRYEDGWEAGSLVGMLLAYNDLLVNKESNDTAAEFVRQKIKSIVKDPEVAELLAPKGHPLGTKRPCLDTGYYDTFNRDNVRLVDLHTSPIAEVTAHGLRTSSEEFDFDVLIFATGFDAMTGPLLGPDIRGRGGVALKEKWAAGPRTYLGVASEGFPNLFMITGPGSPSVMSNMMISIEQHVEWVTDCMAYTREHDIAEIEATREAEDAWVDHVNEAANATLYPSANSWYMGANVPGKARVFMPYIGGVGVYREECDDVVANGYRGFALTS